MICMTDFTDPAGAHLRLSNAERDEAVASLQQNAADGRLDEAELETRTATAKAALTRGDLAPLFADLPGGGHGTASSGSRAYPRAPQGPAGISSSGNSDGAQRSRLPQTIATITPLACVVLFFLTGWAVGYQFAWLWFIVVPIVWTLMYGTYGNRWNDHDRDR